MVPLLHANSISALEDNAVVLANALYLQALEATSRHATRFLEVTSVADRLHRIAENRNKSHDQSSVACEILSLGTKDVYMYVCVYNTQRTGQGWVGQGLLSTLGAEDKVASMYETILQTFQGLTRLDHT